MTVSDGVSPSPKGRVGGGAGSAPSKSATHRPHMECRKALSSKHHTDRLRRRNVQNSLYSVSDFNINNNNNHHHQPSPLSSLLTNAGSAGEQN